MFELFSDTFTSPFLYLQSCLSWDTEEILQTSYFEKNKEAEFYTNPTDSEDDSDDDMGEEYSMNHLSDDEEKNDEMAYSHAFTAGTLQAASSSISPVDSWDDCNDDELKTVKGEGHFSEIKYPAAGNALTSNLKEMIDKGELQKNPAEIFRLIAGNTNPGWLVHSFWNLVTIPKQCYQQGSLNPLFNFDIFKNCVHCARAVEQTLDNLFSYARHPTKNPEILQVDVGGSDNFNSIFGQENTHILETTKGEQTQYLKSLEEHVGPGQRACISVPVASKNGMISHAMNFVNLGPVDGGSENRTFVLCGQSGRVYDLSKHADEDLFYQRYAESEKITVKYALAQ